MYLYTECLFFDEDMPRLGDPWRLSGKKNKKNKSEKTYEFNLLSVFDSSIGCLRWYWSIIKLTPGEFCETVPPVNT